MQEYLARYKLGWNAQTGGDYTVIATVFPADRLEPEIADAAARMGGLVIAESDLQRERPRMLQELSNMFGGMPQLAAMNLSLLLSRIRVAITPGTLHPSPKSAGIIAQPWSPIRCMRLSRSTARRGRYPKSSKKPRTM